MNPSPLLYLFAAAALAGCAGGGGVAPPGPAQPPEGVSSARLGEEIRIGGLFVVPLRIEEDSRCPSGVQCVQAGTVRLAVSVGGADWTRDIVLRLDDPQQVRAGTWLLLAAVCPQPRFPGPVPGGNYHFTFAVGIGGPPPPLDFACTRDS
jgi:hypothetical protein